MISTPHSITQRTPSELMFGGTIADKLPHLNEPSESLVVMNFRPWRKLYIHQTYNRNCTNNNQIQTSKRKLMETIRPEITFKILYLIHAGIGIGYEHWNNRSTSYMTESPMCIHMTFFSGIVYIKIGERVWLSGKKPNRN